jgi:cytochrome c oxidase subunit II
MMRTGIAVLLFVFLCASFAFAQTKTIEVVAQKSFYTPAEIHLKKGEPVRFVIRSADVTHGFAIDAFDIAREIPAGPPVTIEFTPDKTGSFTYYCVVRCGSKHRQMQGTLIVEE